MWSDAELRERKILSTRVEIERGEKHIDELIAAKDEYTFIFISVLEDQKKLLNELELEAADELEMIQKLKEPKL